MSAGEFILSQYGCTGTGETHPINVQEETQTLEIGGTLNAPQTGGITLGLFVKVSRSKREYGICPRKVSICFTGTVPAGYKAGQTYLLPILTEALYNAINVGDTGTYLGEAIQVKSKMPEDLR